VLSACGASAAPAGSSPRGAAAPVPLARPDCGPMAPEVLAQAVGRLATRIYAGELASSETHSDQHQIESYAPLLEALAGGGRLAVQSAVTALVYSHTHIVRLRVTAGSNVLADVGGPSILAPIAGRLRVHGRTLARYVFSVQDDLGYVKLVTRFLDVGLVLRAGAQQVPVEGQLSPAPSAIPMHGPLSYRHTRYQVFSFKAAAFPSGPLLISLFVPIPASLSARTCAAIKSAALGRAAQLISSRFTLSPASLPAYVKLVRTLTGILLYVRSGSRLLAGSTRPAPSALPTSGAVRYGGKSYEVFSFSAPSSAGQVRVYVLSSP